MSFDGLMFRRITKLLADKIVGCSINRIVQLAANDFVLSLYRSDFRDKLIISTNNNASYITISSQKYEDFMPANHFMSVLRHHLEGGVIIAIEQMGLDRILCITVRIRDELGDYSCRHIYVELTGKMTNLILTWENDSIIDSLHRLGPITQRTIMPGAIYHLPPGMNLKDPLCENYSLNNDLSGQFYGFSKNLEKEVRYRIENGESFHSIIEQILTSNTIYVYRDDYHLLPLTHLASSPKEFPWDEGLVYYYNDFLLKSKRDEATKDLIKITKKEIKHLQTKIQKLNTELDKAENSEKYLYYGNILFAYCEDIDIKKSSIIINDIEKNEEVTIPLDEKYTIKENANKYYKKYQKLKTSRTIVAEQIELATIDLDFFEQMKIQIEDADKIELEQITNELTELGYIAKGKIKQRKKKETRYLPQEFVAPDGTKISVGKNNYQNNYLTNTMAKYNEYFFHVKSYSGSHVIVHTTEDMKESTIRYAANLAAYFSKARFSSSVPVDYTIVKNVKKIPSGKLGMVTLRNFKTIYINPCKPL